MYWREQKCEDLWAAIVKAEDAGRCVRCGSNYNVQAHHTIARAQEYDPEVRYNPDLGLTQCQDCHRILTDDGKGKDALRAVLHDMPEDSHKRILIEAFLDTPRPPKPSAKRIDWKELQLKLEAKLAEVQDMHWQDQYNQDIPIIPGHRL